MFGTGGDLVYSLLKLSTAKCHLHQAILSDITQRQKSKNISQSKTDFKKHSMKQLGKPRYRWLVVDVGTPKELQNDRTAQKVAE